MELTKEQENDIKARVEKGLAYLKELDLTPASMITKEAIGDDRFADRVYPYLRDTRYLPIISPVQK